MKPLFVLLAAEGHAPPPLVDIDLTVLVQFVIFLVLLVVLSKMVFAPFLAMQKERDANIDGARKQAGSLDVLADEKIAAYDEKMSVARKESASVRGEFRKEGETQAASILADARAEADAKVEQARKRITTSVEEARKALATRAETIAGDIASKLLGREV